MDDLSVLIQDYPIGSIKRSEVLAHAEKTLYLVETSLGKWVLQTYSGESWEADGLQFQAELLAYLDGKLPVPAPLETEDGKLLVHHTHNGDEYTGLLTRFVDGVRLSHHNGVLRDLGRVSQLGEYLAKFHTLTENWIPRNSWPASPSRESLARLHETVESWAFTGRQMKARLEEARDRVEEVMSRLGQAGAPVLPIHGDLWAGNLLLVDDSLCAVDFDMCGVSFQALDLAVPYYWLPYVEKPEEAERHLDALLEGYTAHRSLDSREIRALPYLAALRHFHFLVEEVNSEDPGSDSYAHAVEAYVEDHSRHILQLTL